MKKNFRSVMNSFFAVLAVAFATSLVSCQDDDYEPYHADTANNPPESPKSSGDLSFKDGIDVYPLIYTSYQSGDDVQITSPDTTTMSISTNLLQSKGIDLKEGNVISVWRDRNELPFMRQITRVSQNGSTVSVTTHDIQACDIIENAKLEFDSKVYLNPKLCATNGDGDFNPDRYVSRNDGVYHPVAIFMHSPEEDAEMEKLCQQNDKKLLSDSNDKYADAQPFATNSNAVFTQNLKGEKKVILTSEIGKLTASTGYNLEVGISGSVKNVCFPLVDDSGSKPDTLALFGIEEASAEVVGGLHASLDISWFSVDKFEIGPYYSIKGKVKPILNASRKLPTWKRDYPIIKTQGYTTVFWVGPIPVAISFKPSLGLALQAEGEVSGSVGFDYTVEGANHAYATYQNGGWSMEYGNNNFNYDFTPVFGGTISASAKASVYLKGEVLLYGVAGPSLKVGPYLQAKAKASLNSSKQEAAAEASLKFGIDATVGAKFEVWSWKLPEWSKTVSLYDKEIWSMKWNLDDWIKNSKKVAEETGNITDDMQEIIDRQEEDEYIDEVVDGTDYKKFINYVTSTPSDREKNIEYVKVKFQDDWKNIGDAPKTFYDWDREYQLWYGARFHDDKAYQIASARLVEESFQKSEYIKKYQSKANVLRILMQNYIFSGIEDNLKSAFADEYEAVAKDWKNIRAEYVRRGQNLSITDINIYYVDKWFNQFSDTNSFSKKRVVQR